MVNRKAEIVKDEIKNWKQAIPRVGVVGLYGLRRKGKSGTAWWLAEKQHEHGRPIASYLFPKKGRKLVPDWVKHVYTIEQLKKLRGYMVIVDELAIHANAREFQSDANKEIYKLMAIAAQSQQLLVLITQHTRQLDVGLAMEADIVIFKQPSILHIRFSRPELKPEVQEAWERFELVKGEIKKKGKAFVMDYHHGRKGFLSTQLPTFWTEDLSEVFSLYEIENLTAEDSKKSRKKSKKQKGKSK